MKLKILLEIFISKCKTHSHQIQLPSVWSPPEAHAQMLFMSDPHVGLTEDELQQMEVTKIVFSYFIQKFPHYILKKQQITIF